MKNGTAQRSRRGSASNPEVVPTLGVDALKARAGVFVRHVRKEAPKNGKMLSIAVNGSDTAYATEKAAWLAAAEKYYDTARQNAKTLREVPASVNTQFIVGTDTNAGAIIREFAGDGGELKKAIVKAFA